MHRDRFWQSSLLAGDEFDLVAFGHLECFQLFGRGERGFLALELFDGDVLELDLGRAARVHLHRDFSLGRNFLVELHVVDCDHSINPEA